MAEVGLIIRMNDEPLVPFVTRDEVEERARDVRRRHGLDSIPIDPVVLANREGITVNNAKFSDDSIVGVVAKHGANTILLVNEADPPFRKRFTIAHELGHHFLHLLEDGEYVDGEADLFRLPGTEAPGVSDERRKEIQANMFAAALLMPRDEVRREWPEQRRVDVMARLFNVSEEAMGYRIAELGLE